MPPWLSSSEQALLFLSAFAGALHCFAPDHWMPISLMTWQKRWSMPKTAFFSLGALLLHLGLGFGLFLAIHSLLLGLDSQKLFRFSVGMVMAVAGIRALRFHRISEVLRGGAHPLGSALSALLFLGPCEVLIPILVKAHHLGHGYLSVCAAFGIGTGIAGLCLVFAGRFLWNQPVLLIRSVSWANQRRSALPIVLGVTAGLVFLLKL